MPEGAVFLFAEKPGFRLSGVRMQPEQAETTLTLTSIDEPAEPLATLPPLASPEEEYALARQVLDPWLERLAQSGAQRQKRFGFMSLVQIAPREAFERLDRVADFENPDEELRENVRKNIISVAAQRRRISWDELRAMIDVGASEYYKAAELILAADEMAGGERALRLRWLDAALEHARKVEDPPTRVIVLASAAERLFVLGEGERAKQLLAEAESMAKDLFADSAMTGASMHLALAAAHDDADRALGWLDKTGIYAGWHGGRVAAKFLPDRPQRAIEIWKRVASANRAQRLAAVNRFGRPLPIAPREYRAAAEFCYRLALADRALADEIAGEADNESLRYWQQGAVILALAETEPAEARKRLAALVREELPQYRTEDSLFLPLVSGPAVAAWLLPLAEKVDPELCRELFWRSLALRPPRPHREDFEGGTELSDIELAKLLGRYDREIARALLEPMTAEASASDDERGRTAKRVMIGPLFSAAVHIDPRWAKDLLDAVGDSLSIFGPSEDTRSQFVGILALPPPERWDGDGVWPNASSAGFWAPSARDKPLPP